jgi:hypothetical protein
MNAQSDEQKKPFSRKENGLYNPFDRFTLLGAPRGRQE